MISERHKSWRRQVRYYKYDVTNTNAPATSLYAYRTSLKYSDYIQVQGMRLAYLHYSHSFLKSTRFHKGKTLLLRQQPARSFHIPIYSMAPKQASLGYVKPAQTTLGSVTSDDGDLVVCITEADCIASKFFGNPNVQSQLRSSQSSHSHQRPSPQRVKMSKLRSMGNQHQDPSLT